jgi:hypothetical protein
VLGLFEVGAVPELDVLRAACDRFAGIEHLSCGAVVSGRERGNSGDVARVRVVWLKGIPGS